jgi:hypothetical protein
MEKVSDPVISYATPQRRATTARDAFGVIVRTIGLALVLWGLYGCLAFLLTRVTPSVILPTFLGNYPTVMHAAMAIVFIIAGVALLRGEWLVRFAYGPESY